MQDTAVNPLVEQIALQLRALSIEDLHTVRDFVDYLAWKHGPAAPPAPKKSAEALAIARIPDLDDPTKWITTIDEGDEVDVDSTYERLRAQGFEIEIPDQKP